MYLVTWITVVWKENGGMLDSLYYCCLRNNYVNIYSDLIKI